MRIPESEWAWYGLPAHFIAANDCRFHMATKIGDVIVSSVGAYYPSHKSEEAASEIGYDRLYETMVFSVKDEICTCGCEMPQIEASRELECLGAQSGKQARDNHMATCERAANGEYPEEDDDENVR